MEVKEKYDCLLRVCIVPKTYMKKTRVKAKIQKLEQMPQLLAKKIFTSFPLRTLR
mgnify:FL=1|jgi:hypothetical protein